MTQQRRLPVAERRIFFYRLDAGLDDDGVPVDLDLSPVLRRIGTMPFTAGAGGRYLSTDPEAVSVCWIDSLEPHPHLRLATVRHSGLPSIEQTGNLRPLLIGADEGVAEQVHVVMFRERVDDIWMTLAASEFNFYGPRVSRLANYLRHFGQGNVPPITFRPLLRHDASEALARLQDIRLFSLRVEPSYIDVTRQVDATLGEALDLARRVGEAEEYEIVMRPKAHSRHTISDRFLAIARSFVARGDVRLVATSFHVSGRDSTTGRVEQLDLLSDKLIAKAEILRVDEAGRALVSEAAFSAIATAYRDLRDELLIAASVLLVDGPAQDGQQ